MRESWPQILFIVALAFNFFSSLIDSNRNSWASLIATVILLVLTYWGGFFEPLLDYLTAAP